MKRILFLLPLLTLVACEGKRGDRSPVLAKIDGTSYTRSDFEFMLKALPPDRQSEILKDPEVRRKHFNTILNQKLQSMAGQKSKFGKNPDLTGRQHLIDSRIITQYFFQTHLAENNGWPLADLQAFHQANSAKFLDDSGKVKPFESIRAQVADSLALAKAPLDSFYNANNHRYLKKGFCEVSFIQAATKKSAEEASKAMAGGMLFPDAVEKYSINTTSKVNKGKVGRLVQGETMWELGNYLNADSLFFNKTTRLKLGVPSLPIMRDSTYIIVKADSCVEPSTPPLDQIRKPVGDDYLTQYKSKLNDGALARLKAKYGVKMVNNERSTPLAELEKYYEEHKDSYMSPQTYDVYDIEAKNQELLAKRIKEVKDLEGFKKVASQLNENPWTKAEMGHVGFIKRDYCLPDGIGIMPSLFSYMDTMTSGLVPGPLQNPDAKKWHYFWLVQKQPKQVKPFKRVLALVRQDYKSEKITMIKPEDTLATYGKDRVIREKDVAFLRLEIPPQMQERYTREALVDYLLTWDLASMEAQELKLTEDIKLQAQREENKMNFWTQIYQDSIVAKNAGLDTLTLKKTFDANRVFFTKDTSEHSYLKYVRDIAAFLTLTPSDLNIEYQTNPERYRHDSTAISYDSSRYDIFQNLKGTAYAKAEQSLIERLEREFQVVILDPTLLPPKIKIPQETYKQAQNLHYDRKLDQALGLYQRLRDEFPKNESLQDSICFGLAQIYIEQEKYQQALAEYRRLSYLFPKSPNNYKAMFMVGFIHAEHLKNDSAAVRAFEKMLAQYPKSDLSDDADWMIRNIRSGGKLMPVLEGDSAFVPQDSASAKDSLPTPNAEPMKKDSVKAPVNAKTLSKSKPTASPQPTASDSGKQTK